MVEKRVTEAHKSKREKKQDQVDVHLGFHEKDQVGSGT